MAKNTIYLYGKNCVLERLRVNPKSIRKIFLKDGFKDAFVLEQIEKSQVPVQILPQKEFMRKKHADRVQGVIALIDKFVYTDIEDLIEMIKRDHINLVVLDGLNDPQNLGVIIRSIACLGDFGIILSSRGSCLMTDTVLHVASGGENFVPISLVDDPRLILQRLKSEGVSCISTVTQNGVSIFDVKIKFPVCLIMGSEAKGLGDEMIELSDFQVTLPMRGAALSFNVAVATSLLCFEVVHQHRKEA